MKSNMKFWLAAAALLPCLAQAATVDQLRGQWAHIRYETAADAQLPAMEQLKATADAAISAEPRNAGLLIWDGIITSTLAGLKGGLGALSLAKQARDRLQQAEQLQPGALDGSALTSLGALYYQVPGWPIGFGNKDKARSSLQAALALDPAGIDTNYFYADFLLSQGDYAGARAAAERAMAAPLRPGREVADTGRRAEIRTLLGNIGNHAGG
jgi:tetratricopeptide (TPR) repeat protein